MSSITLQPGRSQLGRIVKMARAQDRPSGPVPSLSGQIAIITGASSGYGLACAKILPTLGLAHLVLAVRSVDRGEQAAAPLRQAHPNTKIEVWELDMFSYTSAQTFARRCAGLPHLDIAILNAGVTKLQFAKVPSTGHEETIQVNYLSTAHLAILLLPILKPKKSSAPPGHLTIVGSALGLNSKFPQRDTIPLLPALDKVWSGVSAGSQQYGLSKTLVMMLIFKLSQLVRSDDVIINTVEPGYSANTNLGRQVPGAFKIVSAAMQAAFGRTPEQGAWTYVDAAVIKGKESHGSFILNWEIHPFHDIMYTEKGKRTMKQLWDETIEELRPFGTEEALSAMPQ